MKILLPVINPQRKFYTHRTDGLFQFVVIAKLLIGLVVFAVCVLRWCVVFSPYSPPWTILLMLLILKFNETVKFYYFSNF